jgi:hypothetical protein
VEKTLMNMRSLRIAAIRDYSIAGLIVSTLRDMGVRAMDVETASHVSVAGAEQFYYIDVNESQVKEARNALVDMGYQKNLM